MAKHKAIDIDHYRTLTKKMAKHKAIDIDQISAKILHRLTVHRKKDHATTISIDPSEAFDCLPHERIIKKIKLTYATKDIKNII